MCFKESGECRVRLMEVGEESCEWRECQVGEEVLDHVLMSGSR